MSRWVYDDGTLVHGLWCAQLNHPEIPAQVREQIRYLRENFVDRDYPVSTLTDEFELVIYDGCVAWVAK